MRSAAYYDGDAWDILLHKADVKKCLPIVDVLTLAATGSEMDAGGFISNPDTKDKIGLSFAPMLPKVSFLDPELTYSVSKYQTACDSADILSHIFESYFVPADGSMYMLDRFKEGMIKTVMKYAPAALEALDNYEARENLMWASTWAINGFTGAKQNVAWSCHPVEHEISAIYDITHGLGLAILTPRWMRYILDDNTLPRFYDYGVNVFGIDSSLPAKEVAEKSIALTEDFLFGKLGLSSSFSEIGIDGANFDLMAEKAVRLGGLEHAFKPLNADDVKEIFKMCL